MPESGSCNFTWRIWVLYYNCAIFSSLAVALEMMRNAKNVKNARCGQAAIHLMLMSMIWHSSHILDNEIPYQDAALFVLSCCCYAFPSGCYCFFLFLRPLVHTSAHSPLFSLSLSSLARCVSLSFYLFLGKVDEDTVRCFGWETGRAFTCLESNKTATQLIKNRFSAKMTQNTYYWDTLTQTVYTYNT